MTVNDQISQIFLQKLDRGSSLSPKNIDPILSQFYQWFSGRIKNHTMKIDLPTEKRVKS